MQERDNLHPLPPTAQAMAELIGEELTLRIAALPEPQRRYVPKDASPNHPAAQAIGIDQWQRVTKYFGGELIDLPSCARAVRVRKIKQHLLAGSPPKEVAARFGVSLRRINQVWLSLKREEQRGE
jgi:hypothetical protein